jgi:hypothetical protein
MRAALLVTSVAVLVVLFGTSAAAKMANTTAAIDVLSSIGIPERIAIPGAIVLTGAELLIAIALVVPTLRRRAAVVAVALLIAFAGGTLWLMRIGTSGRDCGCFGSIVHRPIGWLTAAQDLAFAGVGMVVIAADRRKREGDS